jgi:hypothetical protein
VEEIAEAALERPFRHSRPTVKFDFEAMKKTVGSEVRGS